MFLNNEPKLPELSDFTTEAQRRTRLNINCFPPLLSPSCPYPNKLYSDFN